MLPTVRKLGGKSTKKQKRLKPSGDVAVETATDVIDYGVYEESFEAEGNGLPPIFKPNLEKYTRVVDDLAHASHKIDFESTISPFSHRSSLRSIIKVYTDIREKCPQALYIISRIGWDRLLNMTVGESSHALIDYIVERWWDKTHTFHFPFGELGFTPADWIMLTGISIGVGKPVLYDPELYTFDHVKEKFFPELNEDAQPPQWTCDAIKLWFLKEYFEPKFLSTVGNNVVLIERLARAFWMYCLGTFFFSNASNYIYAGWLASLDNVKDVGDYDWGGCAFAYLYMSLNFTSRSMKSLNGPVQLLEFWGYEYLGICRPTPNLPKNTDPDTIWPRPSRWKSKKKATVIILTPRSILDRLTYDKVTWRPWLDAMKLIVDGQDVSASEDVRIAIILSNKRVAFHYLGHSIMYLGDRCWKQMRRTFGIPHNPPQQEYMFAARDIVMKKFYQSDNDGNGLDEAWPLVEDFVNEVTYAVYMEYWQHVSAFKITAGVVDWSAQLYACDDNIVNVTVDRPTQHVPIPMPSQLTPAQFFDMLQDNVDFIDQFRKLALKESKDRMEVIKVQAQSIGMLTARNRSLEYELSQRPPLIYQDPQNSSQPVLGFGNFSGTLPSQVWNQVGQSNVPSRSVISNNLVGSSSMNNLAGSSSMNPSRIPFQHPRCAPDL